MFTGLGIVKSIDFNIPAGRPPLDPCCDLGVVLSLGLKWRKSMSGALFNGTISP